MSRTMDSSQSLRRWPVWRELCVVICGVCLVCGDAWAGVLAAWDVHNVKVADGTGIDEGVSPYSFTAGTLGSNIDDAKLSISASVNPETTASKYGFKHTTTPTTLAGAISDDQYIQFTLTAASGYALNLTSLEMNGEATSTGADDVGVLSDVDGFSSGQEIDTATGVAGVTGGFDTDASGFGSAIDLSAEKFQGLSSITFRIYCWNNSGSGSTRLRNLTGDDLVINGATVVANPAPDNPSAFTATAAGTQQLDLSWLLNADEDDVLVAWNSSDTFGVPEDEATYSAGNTLSGGGTVLYAGGNTSYEHTGLNPNQTYFYRAWSIDGEERYSSGVSASGTTDPLPAPVAAAATNVEFDRFSANWSTVGGATGYELDVSLYESFAVPGAALLSEGFEGSYPPSGWTHDSSDQSTTYAQGGTYSARFTAAGDYLITPLVDEAKTLTFWSYTTSADPQVIVEYAADTAGPWTAFPESPYSGDTEQWNERVIDLTAHSDIYIKFRKNGTGTLYVDTLTITEPDVPSFLAGCNALAVAGGSRAVTGLDSDTTYYYRVRAASAGGASTNSQTITVKTLIPPPVELAFDSQDLTAFAGSNFSARVVALDTFGNLATGSSHTVTLSVDVGRGALSADSGLSMALDEGVRDWEDLVFDAAGTLVIRATASGLLPAVSRPIQVGAVSRIVQYGFDDQTLDPSFVHPHVEASDFSYSGPGTPAYVGGVQGEGNDDYAYRSTSWPTDGTLGGYFAFDFTVDDGYLFDPSGFVLSFDETRSTDGPTNWVAYYSTNNVDFFAMGGGQNSIGGSGNFGTTDSTENMLPLQLAGKLYFRIYATNAVSGSGTWRVDNVTVYGGMKIDHGFRVMAFNSFEGDSRDFWSYSADDPARIAVPPDRVRSGFQALELDDEVTVTFDNISLAGMTDVALRVGYAASPNPNRPAVGDQLYLDVSYDDGVSWAEQILLYGGHGSYNLDFDQVNAQSPAGIVNPHAIAIPDSASQVRVRVRRTGTVNADASYYLDDLELLGVPVPDVAPPQINNVLGAFGVTGSQARPFVHVESGYPYPDITLYWGRSDGGTDAGAWEHQVSLGAATWGETATLLTGLSDSRYYFRFHAENSEGAAWADGTAVWFAQQREPGQWYWLTMPAQWDKGQRNRLDSILGEQLARGLNGGNNSTDSSLIYLLGSGGWEYYRLDSDGRWYDADDKPATRVIEPGEGFMIKKQGGSSETVTYSGLLVGTATAQSVAQDAWALVGWPFTESRHAATGAEPGWGFAAAGGQGGSGDTVADKLIGQSGGRWYSMYLGPDGYWYIRNKPATEENRADVHLEPGAAYYYFHRGDGLNWTAEP